MTRSRRCRLGLALLVALLLTGVGCAVSQPAKQVPESGFLADYSRLHKGDEYQAEAGFKGTFYLFAEGNRCTRVMIAEPAQAPQFPGREVR